MNKKTFQIYRQENALLFACLQSSSIDQILKAFSLEKLNWDLLFETAQANRLTPLLFYFLKQSDLLRLVPASFQVMLHNSYAQSLDRGIRQQDIYRRISSALENAGIPYSPLRGIEWIDSIYEGNPALRPMDDIDIFVPPSAAEDAKKTVLAENFRYLPNTKKREHHDRFICNGFIMEIHFRLFIKEILALFPDFDVRESIEKLGQVKGKELSALHYWIHRKHPALWMCDYMRLKSHMVVEPTKGLQWILHKTESLVAGAKNGGTHWMNNKKYYTFWPRFAFYALSRSLPDPRHNFLLAKQMFALAGKLKE